MKLKNKWLNLGILLVSIAVVTVACYATYHKVVDNVKRQEVYDVRDEAHQNAVRMKQEFASRLDFLSSVAVMMHSEDFANDQSVVQLLKDVPKVYGLKRLGFVDKQGMAYTTDGYSKDLSFREFFKNSIAGRRFVSPRLTDVLSDAEPINVFSVPVFNKKRTQVEGVLFATFATENFRNMMDAANSNSLGYCFVADLKGNIVVDSLRSGKRSLGNLREMLAGSGEEARIKTILSDLLEDKSDWLIVNDGGKKKMVYYLPLQPRVAGGNKLALLNVVPIEVLEKRLEPIIMSQMMLIGVVTAVLLFLLGYVYVTVNRREKELYHEAFYDGLTGGLNYAGFKRQWQERHQHVNGYIVAMDLDKFTNIRQSLGLEKSSNLLLRLHAYLRRELRQDELVARVEHDQFILLLRGNSPQEVQERLENLGRRMLQRASRLGLPSMKTSFGIYAAQEEIDLDKAYLAAMQAKNQVKSNYNAFAGFYSDSSAEAAKEKLELTDSFARAIEKKEFQVWFQPKVTVATEELDGAEALVRWRREDGTIISPGKFIRIFEDNGMIAILDEYVFRRTCEQQKAWLREGRRVVPVSVNVSRASLCLTDVVSRYKKIAEEVGLDKELVQIEVTESAMLSNEDLEERLKEFQAAGFKLLLDDFGSGYSSLVSVYKLPFDVIKLDKSLIDYIEESKGGELVHRTIDYVQSMGRKVIAEGVETKTQLDILVQMHCDAVQGFYYAKPMTSTKFEEKYLLL